MFLLLKDSKVDCLWCQISIAKTAEKAVSGLRFLLLKNSEVECFWCEISVAEKLHSGAL